MAKTKKSQNQLILEYLLKGKPLTQLEAFRMFGCFRLGARCWELKQQGYKIVSEIVTNKTGKHFSKYWIKI